MYQFEFSKKHPEMYNREGRQKKADKITAVLRDYFGNELKQKNVLDLGCSTGIMTNIIAASVHRISGIDIDTDAVRHAQEHSASNAQFVAGDAAHTKFPDTTFDVVICAHLYEHVPDAQALLREIHRVLKSDGVCFFAAGNRIRLIEGHYQLPLLSVPPKFLSHMYLRLLGKGSYYYETHRSYWGLRKLVGEFEITDYTRKIIDNPFAFAADDMIAPGSLKQRLARLMSIFGYWFVPTYIWLLRKKGAYTPSPNN